MKKTNIILLVFIIMNFVLAMTSLVFNGILDKVAVSLNISIANTGLLNTMYSYGAAFGVPLTLILFRKIERVHMLKIMLLVTILMTFALVLVSNFPLMLAIRLIKGISANSYGVLAIATVVALSTKERQGRTMALLIMGNSLGLVIGFPLTRLMSSIFDWRTIFWILNIMMIFSLLSFQWLLSKGEHEETKLNIKNEIKFFKDGQTFMIILYSLIMFIGYSAFFTYITPYILILFPSLDRWMSVILFGLGIASFTGNLIGGHISDRIGYAKSLMLGGILQLILLIFIVSAQGNQWFSIAFIILWVLSAWFTGLQLNTGIVQATHNKSSFIISLNASSIQFGFAIGSSIAAVMINLTGIHNILWIAVVSAASIVMIQFVFNRKYDSSAKQAVKSDTISSAIEGGVG